MTAIHCISCDVALDDTNAAVACTEHPICLGCDTPAQTCRDCSLERSQITSDLADDHAAETARDMEHTR